MLDVREDDARVYFLDTRQLRQLLEKEPLIRLDVLGHDSQQKVDIAEHNVAIEHLWIVADRLREIGKIAAAMRCQFDVCEHHRIEANLLAIDLDGLILDYALVTQTLQAPPASGLG